MKNALIFRRFDGGWSTDEQLGLQYSFANSEHVDFRKKPSQFSLLPRTRQEGDNVVDDLIQNAVMVDNGKIYALGDTGFLYERDTSGNWVVKAQVEAGAFGLSYRNDVDKLLIASSKTLSEYSQVSLSPTIKHSKYGPSKSTESIELSGVETTSVGTSLIEGSNRVFTSDIEPLYSIKVDIANKGTGDWTLTLHDEANNTLGTVTKTNANLTSGQLNEFIFTDPPRLYVKPNARNYHFHLHSTVNDGTVGSVTAGDFGTTNYEIWADRLVATKNGMHPIETFLQYECIGNGRYLSVWEPLSDDPSNLEWLRHRVTFPAGLEVCGMAVWNEFLAIATERVTSTTNEPQDGYIFFWDGLSTTYNFFIRVPEGSPYALHEHQNLLYYFAGGAWFAYGGETPSKLRTMANTDSEYSGNVDQTIVYPYMSTVRRGIHLFGFPSDTTNQGAKHGVYSYGAIDKNFSKSFGYSYSISTGTQYNDGANNLKIGMVKNFGDKLFISWQDGASNGLDVVDNSSDPAATGTWESLFFDDELPIKQKSALYMEITFEDLPAGTTITPKYRLGRAEAWAEGTAVSSGKSVRFDINKRFHEIQLGLDLTATTETPVVTAVALVYDDNRKEMFT